MDEKTLLFGQRYMKETTLSSIPCEVEVLYPNIPPMRVMTFGALPNDLQGVMEICMTMPGSRNRPDFIVVDDFEETENTIEVTATEIPPIRRMLEAQPKEERARKALANHDWYKELYVNVTATEVPKELIHDQRSDRRTDRGDDS